MFFHAEKIRSRMASIKKIRQMQILSGYSLHDQSKIERWL